jgi:hypothetical protein
MSKHRIIRNSSRVAAVLAAVVIAASAFPAGPASGSDKQDAERVTLNTLAKKPADFVGKEIRVEGVVTRVMKDDQLFLIADKSACGGCPSKKKCGVFELSISYGGKMPKSRKTVKVTGVLTEPEEGRYLFKAARLD